MPASLNSIIGQVHQVFIKGHKRPWSPRKEQCWAVKACVNKINEKDILLIVDNNVLSLWCAIINVRGHFDVFPKNAA